MPGLTAAKLTATVLRDWTAETERPTQEGAPDCRRANNGSVLRGVFQFFATHESVCGFDLKVVGDRDVAEIVGVVTYGSVVGSLR